MDLTLARLYWRAFAQWTRFTIGMFLCSAHGHPLDTPLLKRVHGRLVKLYCPRCGKYLMTHLHIGWKPGDPT
jgi:hypothetical protein